MPEGERINKSFEELVEDRFVIGSLEDCWIQLKPCIEELGVDPLRVPHPLPRHACRQHPRQHATDFRRAAPGTPRRQAHAARENNLTPLSSSGQPGVEYGGPFASHL